MESTKAPTVRLRKECAWCGLVQQEGNGPTTHTICPDCLAVEMDKLGLQPRRDRRP